jgi:hypothetical protein
MLTLGICSRQAHVHQKAIVMEQTLLSTCATIVASIEASFPTTK